MGTEVALEVHALRLRDPPEVRAGTQAREPGVWNAGFSVLEETL